MQVRCQQPNNPRNNRSASRVEIGALWGEASNQAGDWVHPNSAVGGAYTMMAVKFKKGFTGGINNVLGSMTVEDCVFTDNEGSNVGGAIYSDGASQKIDDELGGVLTVTRCRFVGNSSKGLGGACYLFLYRLDRLLVDRCVFDGNHSVHGGGFASGNGIMEVVDSAFLRNAATYGASIWTSGSKASRSSWRRTASPSSARCASTGAGLSRPMCSAAEPRSA